jgi:light-regulated signal transduction histidine kinase (bacteriophytochrome)
MLSRQNLELEQKNKELNSFTYVASHDLKEPLRKISIFSSRVTETEEQNLSPQGNDYLNKIMQNSNRMQNLIDSILTYARAEREMAFTQTDLTEVAKNAISTLQETIDEKEATVEYANLPVIAAIQEQMEQLFINLISNSLKYSKAGVKPRITINAEKQTGTGATWWKISFADNGIGFDEAYKEKIFQIFQRLHTKDQYSGTGIGLAICKKIMDNHNGSISASSTPNEGAVFTVILPEEQS